MSSKPISGAPIAIMPQRTAYRRLFRTNITLTAAFPTPWFTPTAKPNIVVNNSIDWDISKPIGENVVANGSSLSVAGTDPRTGVMQFVDGTRAMALIPREGSTRLLLQPVGLHASSPNTLTGNFAVARVHKAISSPNADETIGNATADLLRKLYFSTGGFTGVFTGATGNAAGVASNEVLIATEYLASTIAETTSSGTPLRPDGLIFSNLYPASAGEIAIDGHGCDFYLVLLSRIASTPFTSINALFALE